LSKMANTLAVILLIPFGIILYIRCGSSIFDGILLGSIFALLCAFPHELLHAICFKEDVYLYTNLKHGMLFVVGPETMSKRRCRRGQEPIYINLIPIGICRMKENNYIDIVRKGKRMENNTTIIQAIDKFCRKQAGAYETRPFGTYPICYRVMGKIFAQFNPEEKFYRLTLKSEPEKAQLYRQLYPGVIVRGYHCPPVQQPYWNTIDLDAFCDMELLYQMIEEAYEATVKKLRKKDRLQLLTLSKLEYKDTDGEDPDFAMLCDRLDSSLDEMVGKKFQRSQYHQYNQRDSIHDVIVVYRDGEPIACGAFKMYDEDHAELKRIYTEPSCRGLGIGAELVRRLEAKAKIKGFHWCILETGKPLKAACHVYQKAGYQVIPNYGQYVDMPNSICMKKKI
jgi:predicted DNA-binding protein (MmcQ/YjbR family)/GNAT superfamily N-acetyltransferase